MALTQTQIARARAIRAAMDNAGAALTDEVALTALDLYRPWMAGEVVSVGDRRRDGRVLYRCIQAHTTQADWIPSATPALWVVVSLETWPEWVQPTGAHDAYALGAKVAHADKHWESLVANNVWQPGAVGTGALWLEL